MNRIDFSNNGGFPLEQDTLDFMQGSYSDIVAALVAMIGDKVILSGVEVVNGNVTSGYITYNGDIVKFTAGVAGDDVVVLETVQSVIFEDGSSQGVYKTKEAKIGAPGTFPFSDLRRINELIDTSSSLALLVTAFTNHNHDYNTLTNRPAGKIVYMGTLNIGDLTTTDITRTIAHGLNINLANYQVMATMWGNDASGIAWDYSNDVSWIFYDKQPSSFKIGIREYNPVVQNLRLEYMIVIPL